MAVKETFTIEPEKNNRGDVWVWGRSTYPRGSVLAGQTRRRRVSCFDSIEEAQKEYPNAKVMGGPVSHGQNRDDTAAFMRMPAPADFDPADAGEEW
jgi:hypothetical protein